MPDERDEAVGVRQDYDAAVNRIRGDDRLSPQAKHDDVVSAYNATVRRIAELRTAYHDRLDQEGRELLQGVMRLRFKSGPLASSEEKVAAQAMYLDALDRAEAVAEKDGAEGVMRLFRRARNIDSAPQEQACFAIAAERLGPLAGEWNQIVDAYLTAHSDVAEDVDRLRRLNAPSPQEKFAVSMEFSTPVQPPELVNPRPAA